MLRTVPWYASSWTKGPVSKSVPIWSHENERVESSTTTPLMGGSGTAETATVVVLARSAPRTSELLRSRFMGRMAVLPMVKIKPYRAAAKHDTCV